MESFGGLFYLRREDRGQGLLASYIAASGLGHCKNSHCNVLFAVNPLSIAYMENMWLAYWVLKVCFELYSYESAGMPFLNAAHRRVVHIPMMVHINLWEPNIQCWYYSISWGFGEKAIRQYILRADPCFSIRGKPSQTSWQDKRLPCIASVYE